MSFVSVGGERQSVTVRVPATSANLGPGYDCVGICLDIWNDLTVSRATDGVTEMTIEGEGEGALPLGEDNLVVRGVAAGFKAAGKEWNPLPPLKYVCKNRIPYARGLGSSSAAVVGGIVCGLVLCGCEVPVERGEYVLQLAVGIEGHPDNAAPAIYGGLQIGYSTTNAPTVESPLRAEEERRDLGVKQWHSSRVRYPPGMQCVVFLPYTTLETSESRGVLPPRVEREDAIHNVARSALLVNCLANGEWGSLADAMDDRLHQPHRAALNPHLVSVIDAANRAGAHGACLSGAGPSVFAICSGVKGDIYMQRRCERVEQQVADAMIRAAEGEGVKGRVFIATPSDKGAHVVSTEPPYSNLSVLYFGGSP